MRDLIISLPVGIIALLLLGGFAVVSFGARELVRRWCSDEDRQELAEQAQNVLTGVAATFAFFVGFAITVTWGAVTAAQGAVEQQATAVRQMARQVDNIADRDRSADLMNRLRVYATTVAADDANALSRGSTGALPSAAALNRFEDEVNAFAYGPTATERETAQLSEAGSTLGTSAATVAYRRPYLIFVWCLIPAISIAVVAGLAFPFALRPGMPMAPMKAVAQELNS